RDKLVTGVQTCALPISPPMPPSRLRLTKRCRTVGLVPERLRCWSPLVEAPPGALRWCGSSARESYNPNGLDRRFVIRRVLTMNESAAPFQIERLGLVMQADPEIPEERAGVLNPA